MREKKGLKCSDAGVPDSGNFTKIEAKESNGAGDVDNSALRRAVPVFSKFRGGVIWEKSY